MKNSRILMVDDDQNVLEMAECLFKKAGLEVHCAESGEDALGKIHGQNFSVVITDFNMPGMNGLELAVKIKEITPPTPVILITGKPSQELSDLAMQAGIRSVLPKPLHLEQLLDLVDEMIQLTSS